MDQIDLTLLGIMGITLIAVFLAEMDFSITKHGGIYFLRFGRLRISFCRTKEQWQ